MNNLVFRQINGIPTVHALIDVEEKELATVVDMTGCPEMATQLIERIVITGNAHELLVLALRTIMTKDTYPSPANESYSTGAFFKIAKDGLTKAGIL